jgi:antirestriction protein ArdC
MSRAGTGHKRTLAGYSHTLRGDHPGARAASLSDARHRLCRDLGKRFGDEAYAAEELVAEIGAAFLCTELALPNSQTVRTVW